MKDGCKPTSCLKSWIKTDYIHSVSVMLFVMTGFVQTMEKRHRSWKTLEKSWNSKVVAPKLLLSGSSIAP